MDDHDPFNEPETVSARARELMPEEFFWDCADESAPFGSDEGFDAYYEWRDWREEHPTRNLCECLSWILEGREADYNPSLYTDEQIQQDLDDPGEAFLAESYDIFTLDTTIIASGLGQLLDEGRIDAEAKPLLMVAVRRQLHPLICFDVHRKTIMEAIERVIQAA
ncbi:MAG: hypothetical protein KDA70_14645 [Planctomycetaceae bacterium]|nr:hypothetical protein [Planctomycetaceae bacterium]MCA9020960.1 hypothetical protein [Planctomycetaceae bacterium]